MKRVTEEQLAIGQRMEQAWKASGLTIWDLEKITGYTNPTLYRIFSGQQKCNPRAMNRFAEAMGKPVSWFLGEDQDVSKQVAESLVSIFRAVMDGADPGAAFDKTTAEPTWLNPTTRKTLQT